jgi:hypothetical protein
MGKYYFCFLLEREERKNNHMQIREANSFSPLSLIIANVIDCKKHLIVHWWRKAICSMGEKYGHSIPRHLLCVIVSASHAKSLCPEARFKLSLKRGTWHGEPKMRYYALGGRYSII